MGHVETLESRQLLASVPSGFVEQSVVSGLSRPTSMAALPDGRWIVSEQSGKLRIVKNNQLLVTPALTITTDSTGERGLLGVTLDPDFNSNGYVYIYWTVKSSTRTNAVSRYTLVGDKVKSGSGKRLLTLDPLTSANNHNSGALHFGADDKLYIAVGDNADPANSASLATLHGKMLRINKDGTIPTDNPFYNTLSGSKRAIWAYGLRNPFTFAVHPQTGAIHINDVGQKTFEEINLGRAGANYGWPGSEGPTTDPAYDNPLFYYGREVGQAITAGTFYAPATQQFPATYRNDYFFGDYAAGWIKILDSTTNTLADFASGVDRPVDLDVTPDGSVYYLSYAGSIRKITYAPTQTLAITTQPADAAALVGGDATFSVEATGPASIQYQWYRDDQPIDGATLPTLALSNLTGEDNDTQFFVRVSSGQTVIDSRIANLRVITDNTAPVPTIATPASELQFRGGQTIQFSGSATDAEDGVLASSNLKWKIEYITGSVVRPFKESNAVSSGSFTIPTTTPYTEPDVAYRITLTATDSFGISAYVSMDVLPWLSQINLSSSGADVPILVDGQPQASPASLTSVEGLLRTIEAPASYTVDGTIYDFQSWSDNGARVRSINVPADDLTLVATYAVRQTPVGGGKISGLVFNDLNRNGIRDSNEPVIADRRIWVDLNNNGAYDATEPTTFSDTSGVYSITGIPSGSYRVRQDLPTGWSQTKGSYYYYFGTTTSKTNILFASYLKTP